MDCSRFEFQEPNTWIIPRMGNMLVPAIIYASRELVQNMDEKVYQQITNVASLPGIVGAAYAMPDAHWGYGFPIGGVAAFDPDEGGIISAGGVGYDISCGVRLLRTGLRWSDVKPRQEQLADALFERIPAGVGSTSAIKLNDEEMDAMLGEGARWAVAHGYGLQEDLSRMEERGCMAGADPAQVSEHAKERQKPEMGTLGSGNHYLEIQRVDTLHSDDPMLNFGLAVDDIVISIHCGSRGLGHQIGTEFLRLMSIKAPDYGLKLPDRELACAPIRSELGQCYLGAMRAAMNCAFANREILTHFVREVFADYFPGQRLDLLYDVSHNTCKEEWHTLDGRSRRLFVHRKGATRAFGPGHAEIPAEFQSSGQPVFIGGSMGTGSYVLRGLESSEAKAFSSACHGSGRAMSRTQAFKQWRGRELVDQLEKQGIYVRSNSFRGIAEEAPDAYKDIHKVVHAAEDAGLAARVAYLKPLVCVKG
jgi:tRNA-splicing ligase RtcB